MNKEDINFLMLIQDLEQPDFDNACLERENNRLNNDIKTLLKENEAKEKVIKKQDYVINELEKWLKEDLKQVYRDAGYRNNIINEVLDKLKELKEEK